MSKFKVGDSVELVASSLFKDYVGNIFEILEVKDGYYNLGLYFGKSETPTMLQEHQLKLIVQQNHPFNLEQFKSGIPAITRDGRVAVFDTVYSQSTILGIVEGTVRQFSPEGKWFGSQWSGLDLICMQVGKEPQASQENSEPNLDHKRYKWFSQYLVSELVIDSLEEELVACKLTSELDKVLDKYSAIISFNK